MSHTMTFSRDALWRARLFSPFLDQPNVGTRFTELTVESQLSLQKVAGTFSHFLCLPLVCAVSVLHILCLWRLKLSSQWKSTHCVQLSHHVSVWSLIPQHNIPPHGRLHASVSDTYRVPEVRLGILETRLDAQVLRKRHHNVTVNVSLFYGAEITTSSLATTSAVLTSQRAKCVVQSCASRPRIHLQGLLHVFACHSLLLRQQNHRPRVPPGHCEHLRFPLANSPETPWKRQPTQPRSSKRVPHCVVWLASLEGVRHSSELSFTTLCDPPHTVTAGRPPRTSAQWPCARVTVVVVFGPSFLFPCAYPIETCDHKTTGECESKEVDVAFSELTKNNQKLQLFCFR